MVPRTPSPESQIQDFYRTLYRAWGQQHWWPAQSRFEVIVGAYLTQNTAWTNVERALTQLRRARLLSLDGIRRTPVRRLEKLIRSAGYFRQKASRLKTFVKFLDSRHGGSLQRMFRQPTSLLRGELLSLNGVGPETADSILLYAGNHPVFVVDAYTRRILDRHGILPLKAPYDDIRTLFERSLIAAESFGQPVPETRNEQRETSRGSSHTPSRMSLARRGNLAQLYNEMHGLIVGVGKNYCRKSEPRCEHCPLGGFLHRNSLLPPQALK